MEINEEKLIIISNETLDSVHNISIVTPTIYKSVFTKNAALHNLEIEDEEKLTDSILDEKISAYQNIQTETAKNAVKLSDNTKKAISAIKEKDEAALNKVLKETQELKKELEKLKESLYKDELTHAYNRKWLHDTFLKKKTGTLNTNGTLAIIDLNYFKLVNDTYGHVIGDKVLIYIANQLKRTNEDFIRYGGDEFIIIFSNKTSKDSAINKLNNIRESILHKKLKVGDSEFKVSFAFGAYGFKKGDELLTVVQNADEEMYRDKVQIKKTITGI